MTLTYTPRFHLAVPDFLSEPWHAEFDAAMQSIDQALYTAIVAQNTNLWQNDHSYLIGDIIIDPGTGTLYAAALVHTSSSSDIAPTFAVELGLHPTYWTSFAVTAASQSEAEVGTDNVKYMTPLRTAQAITAQSPTPGVATQVQAEEGLNNTEIMTALRVKQATTARIASNAQAVAAVDNTVLMTPLRTSQLIASAGISGGTQVGFSAHKNGTDQTGIANGVATKITFGTELYDLGSFYDIANSRWTPPAGMIHISANLVGTVTTAGSNFIVSLYKNGAVFKQTLDVVVATGDGCNISVDDVANGTDYYEIFVTLVTGTTGTILGTVLYTYFTGHFLGQVGSVTLGTLPNGFRANKNTVDQSGIASTTQVKLTFGTEVFDQGSFYDPALSRWTPPTGMVHIDGQVYISAGVTATAANATLSIFKNGTQYIQGVASQAGASGGFVTVQVSADDLASGTDYYELFVQGTFSPSGTANGGTLNTYFSGHRVGGTQGIQGIQGIQGVAGSTTSPSINSGRLRLVDATHLSFTPFNGDRVKINGVLQQIPVGGIAGLTNFSVFVNGVAGANLAASTTYYVYAFLNLGAMTADFSTTGHSTSTTAGNEGTEIKTGDDTRTLIGMIRTAGTGGTQFVDTSAQRFVLNWFNRRNRALQGVQTNNYILSGGWQEINGGCRIQFLTWAEEAITISLVGYVGAYDTALGMYSGFGIDQVTGPNYSTYGTQQATWSFNASFSVAAETSEGYHFATPMGYGYGYYINNVVYLNAAIRG